MAATTNLPTSKGGGDLDNIAVTREEFRNEIGILLEYLAQALGDVGGSYSNEEVKPAAVILQGSPTISTNPGGNNASQRIPSTKWVKESGIYVSDNAYTSPKKGQLWVDTTNSSYVLKTYNSNSSDWDLISGFPSGTRMLFQQEAAPVGWTKVTSGVNNKALRVTTGNPTIVNTNQTFSTVFTQHTTGGSVEERVLSVDQMPLHSHGVSEPQIPGKENPGHVHQVNAKYGFEYAKFKRDSSGDSAVTLASAVLEDTSADESDIQIQQTGASVGHDHGFEGTNLDLRINYVDVIVAQKD